MRIELLLLLIKHYANNPANCILPHYIKTELSKPYNQHLLGRKHNYFIVNSRASETACGATVNGLLALLDNPTNTLRQLLSGKEDISTPADFDTLRRVIPSTGSDNIIYSSEFLVYQFTISGYVYQTMAPGGYNSHSIDHTFTIIQYRDASRDLRYCMLQSYAGEHSLLEFINASEFNNTLIMSHDEMTHFLNQLEYFVKAKTIDDDIANFYQKYFKIKTKYKSFNLCRGVKLIRNGDTELPQGIEINEKPLLLTVQYVKSDMRSVCNNLNTHITAAQHQDAPQIIEIPENCDSQISQSFSRLINAPEPQNPPNPLNLLIANPFSGQIISKTIDKSQLPILEAFQPKKMTDIKYPLSKNGTLREFKRLIDEANSVTEMQEIFDIACVCVNQHQNTRWDSFWGIQNTSSLREIITVIRDKALNHLFTTAPSEEHLNDRISYFTAASKMSLFNKHKNNFKLTGAFGHTHSLKAIENEIDRLRTMHKTLSPEL